MNQQGVESIFDKSKVIYDLRSQFTKNIIKTKYSNTIIMC